MCIGIACKFCLNTYSDPLCLEWSLIFCISIKCPGGINAAADHILSSKVVSRVKKPVFICIYAEGYGETTEWILGRGSTWTDLNATKNTLVVMQRMGITGLKAERTATWL